MSKNSLLGRLRRDESGATAAEYGLVMPVLIFSILGAIWAGLLMFSNSSLDMAVQAAARCMAVDAVKCGSPGATEVYALSQYTGPDISPAFTATISGCGHTVTAEAKFDLGLLPGIADVPLSTSACYP